MIARLKDWALALAGIILAIGAALLYGRHRGKEAAEDAQEARDAQAAAAMAALQARAERLQASITHAGDTKVAQGEEESHETVRYVTRVVHDHPAPAVCVAPADSVRQLAAARAAANAAAGPLRVAGASSTAAAHP